MMLDSKRAKIIHNENGTVDIEYKKSLFSKEFYRNIEMKNIVNLPEKETLIILPKAKGAQQPQFPIQPQLPTIQDLIKQREEADKKKKKPAVQELEKHKKEKQEEKKKKLKEVSKIIEDINF